MNKLIRKKSGQTKPDLESIKQPARNSLQNILLHPAWYLWIFPAILALAGQRFLAARPDLAENLHAKGVFRWLSIPLSWLSSLIPISLTEILLLAGTPILAAGLVIWLIRMIRTRQGRLRRLGRLLQLTAWVLSSSILVFMLLHGFNYARLPVSQSFELPAQKRSADELAAATAWLIEQTNQLRRIQAEDENGVFQFTGSIGEMLRSADRGYQAAAADYPLLAGIPIRPKPVMLSAWWSYTGITGMYFPFLAEANVNQDIPHYQMMDTALHEIAHVRGFAREDEANFMAFLTGLYHPDTPFVYAAMLSSTNRCLNALYSADREQHAKLLAVLDDAVRRDLNAAREYWRQFEGPVRTASTTVNNAYLQANLQEDGVRSYGRMVDLVLAWYSKMESEDQLEGWSGRMIR